MEEKKVLQKRINIDNNKQKAMNKKLKNRINYERPQIHENKKVDEMIYRKFGKFVLLKRQNLHKNEILNETDLGGRFPKKNKNINQKGLNLINKENPKKYKIRTKSAEIEKKKDDKNIIIIFHTVKYVTTHVAPQIFWGNSKEVSLKKLFLRTIHVQVVHF